MCCGHPERRSLSPNHRRRIAPQTPPPNINASAVEDLRDRLAETEARIDRARAREAELTRRLEEMKRFVSVMEILENYLKRRFREHQDQIGRLFGGGAAVPAK